MNAADAGEGVRAAIAAYTHALDDGHTDDVVATFCADGSCDIPGLGTFSGHDELRAGYASWQPPVPMRHLVANTRVTDWSDDESHAISDVFVFAKGKSGWTLAVVGRYHDHLHHTDGTWRFHHRRAEFAQ